MIFIFEHNAVTHFAYKLGLKFQDKTDELAWIQHFTQIRQYYYVIFTPFWWLKSQLLFYWICTCHNKECGICILRIKSCMKSHQCRIYRFCHQLFKHKNTQGYLHKSSHSVINFLYGVCLVDVPILNLWKNWNKPYVKAGRLRLLYTLKHAHRQWHSNTGILP